MYYPGYNGECVLFHRLPLAVTHGQDGEKTEIMTSQCEAYEVMKMKEQPRRAEHTTTAATGPDATYEEVGEGLVSGQRRVQEAGATPQQEQTTQQVYEEVSHGTEKNIIPADQSEESSHYD